MMENSRDQEVIGTVLSAASTAKATCLLKIGAEGGRIKEGMLLIVRSNTREGKRDILARVEAIQPIDESYEAGGFLTEAIRKGMQIPSDISRRFETAELDLLFGIKASSREIRYPPLAGDAVMLIKDEKRIAQEIFGIKEGDMIIECGTLSGYKNLPVMFSVESLPMHLGVFGITGSGKSYNMGAIIEKLASIPWKKSVKEKSAKMETKHFPIVAIDPNGDYVDYWDHFIINGSLGNYPKVIRYVFRMTGVNLTLPSKWSKDPKRYMRLFNIDLNEFNKSPVELAKAIIVYYAGDVSGRQLQTSNLGALLKHLIDKKIISNLNVLFTNQKLFDQLVSYVHNPPKGISIHHGTRDAIERQLLTFRRDVVEEYSLIGKATAFTGLSVDDLVKDGGMAVIDFTVSSAAGYPPHVKQFVVYYIAYILFKRFVEYKLSEPQQRSLLLVIEESQNYCPNLSEYKIGYSLAREVLQQIATQGRKFGLCLCLLTQRPSYVDPVIMSMCNSFLVHRTAPGDELFVRRITGGLPKSLERRLAKLNAGEVIVTGQSIKSGLPILANIRKDIDRVVKQKAGEVKIAAGLPK